MPSKHPSTPKPWDAEPIIEWLLTEGPSAADVDHLVAQLGERLLASGAPVWRLRLSMRTLHPLIAATSSVWERDRDTIEQIESTHGLEARSGYIGSPMQTISETGAPLRIRLMDPLPDDAHIVLHELKEMGGTDYFGLPTRFSDISRAIMIFVTDVEHGFSDADIAHFSRIAAVTAPVVAAFNARRVSEAIADAYLGPRTGRRVLNGQITRGNIETMTAAIVVSDIRDWTGLNSRIGSADALELANRYFETVAEAIEVNGGEILKFLGDGVLAVFPSADDEQGSGRECIRALAAGREALQNARDSGLDDYVQFGIGMHYGEVLYGNIGSKTRLDFTVLGQAVNIASRIEGLCGKLDRPILFSEEFARRLSGSSVLVAEEVLKGQDTQSKVFTAT